MRKITEIRPPEIVIGHCVACGQPDTFISMEIRREGGMELLLCKEPTNCRRHWPAGDDLTRKS